MFSAELATYSQRTDKPPIVKIFEVCIFLATTTRLWPAHAGGRPPGGSGGMQRGWVAICIDATVAAECPQAADSPKGLRTKTPF